MTMIFPCCYSFLAESFSSKATTYCIAYRTYHGKVKWSGSSNDQLYSYDGDGSSQSPSSSWSPPKNFKGVFCGSGSDMMNDPRPIDAIVDLVQQQQQEEERNRQQIKVVYLGTATYDIDLFKIAQTQRFVDIGCEVIHLKTTNVVPTVDAMSKVMSSADVIVVAGGNTLFALDR